MASLVALDNAMIDSLLNPGKRKPLAKQAPATNNGTLRKYLNYDVERVEVTRTAFNEICGHYDGKAGTMRRSRKGRSSRNANGRRFYVADFTSNKDGVLAYSASNS